MSTNTIDVLFEDPPVNGQKFALVTIVGPNMPQKCNVWGMKVRGVTDNLESAKGMTQRLMRVDNNYDIYTVEVGKFFPLVVEPSQVTDVEYQNSELNKLMKSYLENREHANEQWHARKSEMIKKAIAEGREQNALGDHPIAVFHRIKQFTEQLEILQSDVNTIQQKLHGAQEQYNAFSEEERQNAENEFKRLTSGETTAVTDHVNDTQLTSNEVTTSETNAQKIDTILNSIKMIEEEITELEEVKRTITMTSAPKLWKRTSESLEKANGELSVLKEKLTNVQNVNDFINSAYNNSQYEYLQS